MDRGKNITNHNKLWKNTWTKWIYKAASSLIELWSTRILKKKLPSTNTQPKEVYYWWYIGLDGEISTTIDTKIKHNLCSHNKWKQQIPRLYKKSRGSSELASTSNVRSSERVTLRSKWVLIEVNPKKNCRQNKGQISVEMENMEYEVDKEIEVESPFKRSEKEVKQRPKVKLANIMSPLYSSIS